MPAPTPTPGHPSVLMIGSEALPFSKTGGLADVLGALPLALSHLGWDVTLVTPQYRGVTTSGPQTDLPLVVGGQRIRAKISETSIGEKEAPVRALLVDVPDLFDRDGLYASRTGDFPDNPLRFAVLARAALQWAVERGVRPTAVHAHDWQGGLVPLYLKSVYAGTLLDGVPSVFTIHNLAYQGLCGAEWTSKLDVPPAMFSQDGAEFWGHLSFLKAGISYASAVTTVSPRYASEIQTPELGFGFDGVLRKRSADLSGVLNGIDTVQWDPGRDAHLPARYDIGDLSGKHVNKRHVLQRYGLADDEAALARPLIGMISRMVDQKGLDLLAELSGELATIDASFVVLGTGEPRYEDMWRALAAAHPATIGVNVGFDEALAHQIEAGADMFLMPSKFEPCGLNQMYSLRYGTVPIVREVGGLADTVRDGVTGFAFSEYSPAALREVLRRALAAFADRRSWLAIQAAGMAEDHSWDRSAREYVRIYERVSRLG